MARRARHGLDGRYVTIAIGRLLAAGELADIVGVPTSEATAALAREHGVPLATLAEQPAPRRVPSTAPTRSAPGLGLVKGLGGALLREKIVASAADALRGRRRRLASASRGSASRRRCRWR